MFPAVIPPLVKYSQTSNCNRIEKGLRLSGVVDGLQFLFKKVKGM